MVSLFEWELSSAHQSPRRTHQRVVAGYFLLRSRTTRSTTRLWKNFTAAHRRRCLVQLLTAGNGT